MSIVANLIRSMKPKMLESFKDYHAQKEFVAKVKDNKTIIVVLKKDDNKNVISNIHNNQMNDYSNIIKVYQFQLRKK